MVYFNNTSAARSFGRNLCLLLLLLSVPSCRSQAPKYACFKPTDGYKYPGFGGVRPYQSVLGLAVRHYVRGNKAVRTMYGQNINDWCVGRVTAMDYIFYELSGFNEPLHNWDVSSVTTMRGMVRISTNHECCQWLLHQSKTHTIGTFIVFLVAQFDGASAFNRNIASWNVAAVTNMASMVKAAV
jgi:surface protein